MAAQSLLQKTHVNFPFISKTSKAIFEVLPAKHTTFTVIFCYLYTYA